MNLSKSYFRLSFSIVCATSCLTAALADSGSPFSRSAMDFVRDEIHIGVNIGNTLDVPSGNETDWGRIEFGADPGKPGCVLATPEKPVITVELPLPDGALDPKGKGIGAELKFIPGAWGQNRPLDAELSPIEIH